MRPLCSCQFSLPLYLPGRDSNRQMHALPLSITRRKKIEGRVTRQDFDTRSGSSYDGIQGTREGASRQILEDSSKFRMIYPFFTSTETNKFKSILPFLRLERLCANSVHFIR